MTLIAEIQDDVIDSGRSLPSVLRKFKVLAAQLGVPDLTDWADRELNGYQSDDDLPPYRTIPGQNVGVFSGSFGRMTSNMPIPVALIPEGLKEQLRHVQIREGVRYIESMAADSSDGVIGRPWPGEWVQRSRDDLEMQDGSILVQAWTRFTVAALEGVLDSIRNRTLDFLLRLQEAHPDLRTSNEAATTVPAEETQTTFSLAIFGGQQNIVTGGSSISQSISIGVEEGVLESLFTFLTSNGVASEDIDELHAAIEDDGPSPGEGKFGRRVATWMGSMVTKAGTGVWKVAVGSASGLLTKALSQYYGL